MNLARLDMASDWRRFWWVAPPVVLALCIFTGIRVFDYMNHDSTVLLQDWSEQHFEASAVRQLTIDDAAGDVIVDTVRPGQPNQVRVTVIRQGSGPDYNSAFYDLGFLQLQVQQTGDAVVVRGWRDVPGGGPKSGWQIHVTVPPTVELSVRSGRGNVQLSGLTSNIKAVADAGSVVVALPKDRSFVLLDGAGSLQSDFPLARRDPAVPGEFAVAGATPLQQLELRAPAGRVRIIRQ